jgi:hypothetical protein
MVTGNQREGDGRSRDGGGENEASTRAALSLSTAQGYTWSPTAHHCQRGFPEQNQVIPVFPSP